MNATDKRKYTLHRIGAKARGIPFLLTFSEWWDIWQQSGHYAERGAKVGQYCMSRYGDLGPYAIGNVFIQLHSSNSSEGNKGKVRPLEVGKKISASKLGKKHSPERCEINSKAQTGKKLSAETLARRAATIQEKKDNGTWVRKPPCKSSRTDYSHTLETLKKISMSKKGKPWTQARIDAQIRRKDNG